MPRKNVKGQNKELVTSLILPGKEGKELKERGNGRYNLSFGAFEYS